jgi:hypothetical protein
LTVETEQTFKAILQNTHSLGNKTLLAREFIQNAKDMDRIDLETCLRRICVLNITLEKTEDEFSYLMQNSFGPIEKSYMREPKGSRHNEGLSKFRNRVRTKYGFVTFLQKHDRNQAVEHGQLVDPDGRAWQIKAFRSKNEHRN